MLVTGAGGFIGSHLVEQLARAGAIVRAFVRYNSRNDHGWLEALDDDLLASVDVFRGDLVNPEAALGAVDGCDTVFHLGALIPIPYSYRHPREFVDANVAGTLNVLEASRRHRTRRIVHTSTSEVYGTARVVPIDEEHPLQAQSPYAATKIAADQLALSFTRSFDLPVVVARPFNTFGPRQSARAVIPTIITQALSFQRIEIGSLEPTRDFVYVSDTAAGLIACGEAPGIEGEVINLGTGVEISIGSLIETISRIASVEAAVVSVDERRRPRRSEVERLVANADKARTVLGWTPQVELEEGLRRTVEWTRSALQTYKPGLYQI